ncbi:DUF2508 family protein [Caproiciproducens galactitolivorans]|uniref:DUF2508 domain-containing protein n=1 Tax=Caproiciproducens galactitolivorans TaxID=642589 RepID=A0A4Z0YGR7_9FIRM|nr:DUF2508 family protein [Caproiciproducens galactitolivorans]QEY34303.1 DUF2508 family protein [Caproiciproducens galactitolivorans]TGJ77933.1 hypothetical protein CAGA_03420 [Caproiciproducens galactitolivorans]
MESVLKLVQHVDCTAVQENQDKDRIMDEIKEVCRLMACNESWFALESDENLIEACIYQRESLKSRYRYLLKQARLKGINAPLICKGQGG